MTVQELEGLLAAFKKQEPRANPTVAELREDTKRLVGFLPIPDDISVESQSLGGVSVDVVSAPGAGRRTVLYLHGGGYVICNPRTHRRLAYDISKAGGARCVVPDYRLAPEHPFPAAVEDAVAVYRALLDAGTRPDEIVIAGDSAGGGLTIATLVALRDQNIPLPAAGVCISPWTDMEATGESMAANDARDPMVQKPGLLRMANWYLNGADPRTPLAAPLHADLAGLPPLMIQVGEVETLLDDSSRLAERAKAAGLEVDYAVWPRMFHVWHLFAPMLSEGREAIAAIGQYVRSKVPSA